MMPMRPFTLILAALLPLCLGLGDPPTGGSGTKPETTKPDSSPDARPPAQKPVEAAKPADAPTPVLPDDILHCKPQKDLPREKLRLFDEDWDTELCLDSTTRAIGMGGRTEFPPNTAMLFVYPTPDLLSFWMKDCLIDMDMVFVDADGMICALHEAKRQPLRKLGQAQAKYESSLKRYSSNRAARFCVELPAGSIKRIKPQLGQKLGIDWSAIARRAR
jgi:uncharacterized membrane protein (UPF0127 family)